LTRPDAIAQYPHKIRKMKERKEKGKIKERKRKEKGKRNERLKKVKENIALPSWTLSC
jgi:hypothetical protein